MCRFGIGLLCLALMILPAMASNDVPDAAGEFSGGSVAAGIGYTWGTGMLIYQGRLFRLQVRGLSIADVGITSYTASGDVYNLKKPSDSSEPMEPLLPGRHEAAGSAALRCRMSMAS